jgi:hypothetical protein
MEWLGSRWRSETAQLPTRIDDALALASAEVASAKTNAFRRFIGWLLILVVDVAMTAAVGLALWRVAWAFVEAQYLGAGFAANFAVLLVCLYLIGRSVVSLFFSSSPRRFRRQLEQKVASRWAALVEPFGAAADEFLNSLQEVMEDGEALASRAQREIGTSRETARGDEAVQKMFHQPQA